MRVLLLALLLALAPATVFANTGDDDDSALCDDDDSAATPDDAATYGWLCGVGAPDGVPASALLALAGVGLLVARRR